MTDDHIPRKKTHNDVQDIMTAGLEPLASQHMLTLMEQMFYDQPCHCPGDPYETAYRLGMREVISFMREFKPKEA